MARLTVLDDIIGNPRRLHTVTLCTAGQFDYILHGYATWIKEHGDTTLFWDDDVRASDAGNRSRLYIRHSLLLSLMRKKEGTTQAELAAMFGVDQSSINRSLEASNCVLSEVLPTAHKMSWLIREVDTLIGLKRMIPRTRPPVRSPSCWTVRTCPSTGPATGTGTGRTIRARRRRSPSPVS